MALIPIRLKPGVDTQATPLLNSGGWSAGGNIRFFQGLAEKDAGFVRFTKALANAGVPRALQAWRSLAGQFFLAIAGDKRLNVFASDVVYDITPSTVLGLPPISISTTAGSTSVVINDAIDPAPAVGENVIIREPVSVANVVLLGPYLVTAVGASQFTINAQVQANTTITGGNVRQITTAIGQKIVMINLPNHGLYTGETTSFQEPTPVGGINLVGNYTVSVVDVNNYTVTATTSATFSSTVIENGGSIRIIFSNPPTGGFQRNFRSFVSTLANWGEFLFWNPRGGPVYEWQPALGLVNNPATVITGAPQANNSIFVATQQFQLFCLGTIDAATGLFDPLLVRWSDVLDFNDFVPTASNQAGSFRVPTGSALVGGLSLAGGNLIWTDLALYTVQYLGFPLVWGFQPIGVNCGLIGPKAFGSLGETVFWMSRQQFYQLAGGAPQALPCTVWDLVFKNLDPTQTDFIIFESNAFKNEVSWEVPQLDGTVTRARVDITTGLWNYTILPSRGFLPRTAWIDQSVFGAPLAGDASGTIWQHETGFNAGDEPLEWMLSTGQIMISEGDDITYVREFLPDFKTMPNGTPGPGVVQLTIFLYNDAQEPPSIKGPFLITSTTRSVPVMGRGRSIEWEYRGTDLGSWIRIGDSRIRTQPDGRA